MGRSQVLIIDENITHQKLAALMSQRIGMEPIVAFGFEDAIKHLECKPHIKIVLVDLNIPRSARGNLSLRMLNRFRRLHKYNFAIIASTAHVMQSDLLECLRLGADDVLPKPYTSHNFRETLTKWTDVDRVRLAS